MKSEPLFLTFGGIGTAISCQPLFVIHKQTKDSARVDPAKVKAEAGFDGKWVLVTNTELPTDQVALKYKEMRQVE